MTEETKKTLIDLLYVFALIVVIGIAFNGPRGIEPFALVGALFWIGVIAMGIRRNR